MGSDVCTLVKISENILLALFIISNVHIIDYVSKSPSQTLNALKVVMDGVKLLLQIKGIL